MTPPAANFNFLWARAIAQELHRAGVRQAAIAPGSRSAPLAFALHRQAGIEARVFLDERSAAFFALGAAKATGRPAVALATSGSAGAHFFPAVLEAEAAGLPLIAITADRPPELHGFGAAQTCDQDRLFGTHALFAGLSAPEPADAALIHLRSVLTVCLSRARRCPLQINVPLREPLAPVVEELPSGLSPRALDGPVLQIDQPRTNNQSGLFVSLAAELAARPRGLIVCGPRDAQGSQGSEDALPAAVAQLASATGYAVLAEAASGVRRHLPSAVTTYDAILRSPAAAAALKPQAVIRIGGGLTSKVLQGWLDQSAAFTVLLSESGAIVDPAHAAATAVIGDAAASCEALAEERRKLGAAEATIAARFAAADACAKSALEAAFARSTELTEPRIAREVAAALPASAQLFVSSSMPVRDLDAFAPPGAEARVLANRGLNGIDGVISTALGAAASTGRPTAVLIGDLALLHDLGGLVSAKRLGIPLTAVVVNNDGGGIFHFLPVAAHAGASDFEALFGTPHGLDLAHAAALASAGLHRPANADALRAAVRESIGRGVHLVEVRTDRRANVAHHRELQAAVIAALEASAWR